MPRTPEGTVNGWPLTVPGAAIVGFAFAAAGLAVAVVEQDIFPSWIIVVALLLDLGAAGFVSAGYRAKAETHLLLFDVDLDDLELVLLTDVELGGLARPFASFSDVAIDCSSRAAMPLMKGYSTTSPNCFAKARNFAGGRS